MHFVIDTISSIMGFFMCFFYRIFDNYGIAIVFFTILTKIFLFPINILIQKNSIKMVCMQPEISALKIKYLDDKEKFADEELAVYKNHKYHPLLGIVPLILQLILIMGVLGAVYKPLTYILRLDPADISILEDWLAGTMKITEAGNSAQIQIIELIHAGNHIPMGLSEKAVNSINHFNLDFLGIDLGAIPNPLKIPSQIIIPLFAGISAYLLCFSQNKINILQLSAGKLNRIGTTAFMIGFSLYLVFLVPQGVGLYWICGNLFAIPPMILLNILIPPQKYVDLEYLKKVKAEAAAKEQKYKKYHKVEKADYKRFFSVEDMQIMIYAEGKGYYKYFADIIQNLLAYSDYDIHYITSDPEDPVLDDRKEQFHTYYIASDQYLIPLFMKLDCSVVLLTTPDLEKYHLKRSRIRNDIEYIYMMHGIGNVHLAYRKGALDHYDTMFLQNKNTELEVRFLEETYGTKHKRLVETGSPLIDMLRREYATSKQAVHEIPQIMIAPSWQPDNIIDLCAGKLLDLFSESGFKVILRPHPQQVRYDPALFDSFIEKYKDNPNIIIQTDFSENTLVMDSDLLITDWSGISYEFAFVTKRPVIFIKTPMKIMNPDFDEHTVVPGTIDMDSMIGRSVELTEIDMIVDIARDMMKDKEYYREQIEKTYNEYIYGKGQSGRLCALYMIQSVKKRGNIK